MDCLTCHNRITHEFRPPAESVHMALSRGLIDPEIPSIRLKAVEVLSQPYADRPAAVRAIADLERYYQNSAYEQPDKVQAAIATIQDINTLPRPGRDWTYPNNLGYHAPGGFGVTTASTLSRQDYPARVQCPSPLWPARMTS
jgi:hypothetical protein